MQQRDQNVYFVGRILNDKEDADDNAKTFAFSRTERASLQKQLKGIPVQLEHTDSLKVGEIMNSWRDNQDNFYVYGQISGTNLKNTFAKHAIQKKGPNSKPYYGGLSLQHVHREWKDGTTEKAPIEVSLVTEPRRRNCDIVWVSNDTVGQPQKETKEERYIGTLHAASDKAAKTENKNNNMATLAATPVNTPAAPPDAAPAAAPVATPAAPTEQEAAAATGIQLNEQVFSEMSQLYEKEKAQQEELAKLKEQLKLHEAKEEEAKAVKQQEEAAKGRALISSMLEHMKDLLGSSSEVQTLEPQLMKLGQAAPSEMNNLLEVISKASKKYKNQQIELQQANNSLNEKTLELKFQKLIKQHGIVTTTEVASSRKRTAPEEASSSRAPTIPVKAATITPAARNPYLRAAGIRQNRAGRNKTPMNKELLTAFMSNRAGGARQSMAKLHTSLQETLQQRNMFPGRY